MKVVIAGSRKIHEDYYKDLLIAIKNSGYEITEVVSGCAIGVDRMGERFARSMNIPVKPMPADWTRYGTSAGPIRNKKMAEYADAAIILWDGESPGSKNMFENMKTLGKPVYLWFVQVPLDDNPHK
jgi:YspA, cpYpsA-related SLOG family